MPRVITLGCGTGVGKTKVSTALLRALGGRGLPVLGLRPVESGVIRRSENPIPDSDAAALAGLSTWLPDLPLPLYALAEPVSPHLAARAMGLTVEPSSVAAWVAQGEASVALRVSSHRAWTVIETAGGVFSPLGPGLSNFDLALSLEPAVWVLVASDSLGVLHDLSATLQAMRARGRAPDHVVLSAARAPDLSTGRNAAELAVLGITPVTAALGRNDDSEIETLADALLDAR